MNQHFIHQKQYPTKIYNRQQQQQCIKFYFIFVAQTNKMRIGKHNLSHFHVTNVRYTLRTIQIVHSECVLHKNHPFWHLRHPNGYREVITKPAANICNSKVKGLLLNASARIYLWLCVSQTYILPTATTTKTIPSVIPGKPFHVYSRISRET